MNFVKSPTGICRARFAASQSLAEAIEIPGSAHRKDKCGESLPVELVSNPIHGNPSRLEDENTHDINPVRSLFHLLLMVDSARWRGQYRPR